MKCENCGSYLVGNEKFCNGCGSPVHRVSNNIESNNNINNQDNMNSVNVTSDVPPKKNNTKLIILIVFLVLLVGGLCAFGGYMLAKNSDDSKETEQEDNTVVSTSVYYAGTTFMLPDDYIYNYNEQGLCISDGKWVALIQENPLPYNTIILAKEGLKTELEKQGMEILSLEEKKVSSNEYLVISANVNNANCLILITELKNEKTLLIMMTDPTGMDAKESWINDLDKVLSSTKTIDRNINDIDFSISDKIIESLEEIK